jgi:hypothetical protein
MSAWSKSTKPVITGYDPAKIYMVDEAECAANPGISQPGWVYRTTVGSRKKYETLVAMAAPSTDVQYETAKQTSAGSFVVGTQYKILTAGTTNFTLIGAANNNVGTTFTATGAGSGTGKAVATSFDDDSVLPDA